MAEDVPQHILQEIDPMEIEMEDQKFQLIRYILSNNRNISRNVSVIEQINTDSDNRAMGGTVVFDLLLERKTYPC